MNCELESLDGSLINFWEENRFKSDFARTLERENVGALEDQLKDAQTRRKLAAAEKTIAHLRNELSEYKKKLVASEKRNEIAKADCKVCDKEAKSKAEKAKADKAKADKAKREAESVKCEVCQRDLKTTWICISTSFMSTSQSAEIVERFSTKMIF